MDPISLGLGVVGLGMQLWGQSESASASKEYAMKTSALARGIAGDEQRLNEQKRIAMELSGKRQVMEVFRNNQRLRAQATAAAVNQGAQFGTGLLGGLAQIEGQSQDNALAINQGLITGRNIFGINNDISDKKMQQAQLQAQYQTSQADAQGLSSLGGALMKIGPTVGAFGKDAQAFFSKNSFGTGFAGPYV